MAKSCLELVGGTRKRPITPWAGKTLTDSCWRLDFAYTLRSPCQQGLFPWGCPPPTVNDGNRLVFAEAKYFAPQAEYEIRVLIANLLPRWGQPCRHEACNPRRGVRSRA